MARESVERREEADLLCSRELGGTSCTWRLSGWFDFEGGGRTTMNACEDGRQILASVVQRDDGGRQTRGLAGSRRG